MAGGAPPFVCDIGDIKNVIVKENGNIMAVAEHYGVHRQTIYRFIEANPELKPILEDARMNAGKDMLDLAMFVSKYNILNYKNNPSLAQQVATKMIDREDARNAMQQSSNINVVLSAWAKPVDE